MYQTNSQDEGILSNGKFLASLIKKPFGEYLIRDNKRVEYYNIPAGFDIETSSFYDGEKKCGIMYCWQFGIGNIVTLGRTWEEFLAFIEVLAKLLCLNENRKLVVYVHNLPYEFQFIRKRLSWEKVFFLDERKPVYATTISGIEFRCSLKLSGGKSLANVGKDLMKYKVKKLEGFLDYNQLRTPLTPLTDKEMKYCENDIRVILSYIREKIEQDGDITKIPLTNTGYVRQYCRKMCYTRWKSYRRIMENLTIEPEEYSQLERAFQGGFTHANTKYVRKTLENVGSHDFGSSYPGVMLTEKFPMSKAKKIEGDITLDEFKQLLLTKCCLFDVEFWDIEAIRFQEHPISQYKCKGLNLKTAICENGRVVKADHLITTITEQDFFTYLDFYTFSKVNVGNIRVYDKNYLPKKFVESILELYRRKTVLKGIKEEEGNYMISKNMINASFGMSVTKPIRDVITYSDDNFIIDKPDIVEAIETYNKNIRRFLFYPWGVWITAYARANLFSGIAEIGDDYVYSDTDSIKTLNTENHKDYFERYNQQMVSKIERAAAHHRLDINLFWPCTAKGKKKVIGLWEDEGVYEKFKTLGAKRYLTYKTETSSIVEDDGTEIQLTEPKFELTVAGANKVKSMAYLRTTKDPFGNFDNGLKIPKEYSGRLILTYIDDEIEGDIVDMNGIPYHYHELSCVHMEQSDYHLSMTEEFIRRIQGIQDFGE